MSGSQESTRAGPVLRQVSNEAFCTAAQLGTRLVELGRQECLELLAAKSVGRIAYAADFGRTHPAGELSLVDECITFRTVPDGEIYRHAFHPNCAFEIDETNEFFESG